ncbi:MAG: hypothetical protein LBO82_06030 [Synergistaceae bacterium]|jgi:hypothetical protein|nr:hypothetical protein [Synergistaceae bacterium]
MNIVSALSAAVKNEKENKEEKRDAPRARVRREGRSAAQVRVSQTSRILQGRPAFTLVELSIAIVISVFIIGAVILLMGRGIDMAESNSVYARLQNAALSSFEFLPKDIGFTDVVEIIENPSHSIAAAVESDNRWHYISKAGGKVAHTYWKDGAVKTEPVTGSELVANLEFRTDVLTGKAARMARVRVGVQDGHSQKKVTLDRFIQVRAIAGVTGENGAPASTALNGPILRFRGWQKTRVDLEIFAALDTRPVKFSLNMTSPDTWTTVDYDVNTQFDAALTFKGDAGPDESEPPIFTWLVADGGVFFRKLKEAGVESSGDFYGLPPDIRKEKLLEALEKWMIPEELEYADDLTQNRKNLANELSAADPFRKNTLQPEEPGYGYRVVEVSRSAPTNLVTPAPKKAFRVIQSGSGAESPSSPRFQWGKAVFDNITQEHNLFGGSCIIAIARFKTVESDKPLRLAAAVGLDEKGRHLWDTLMDIARAKNSSQLGNGEYKNTHPDFSNASVTVTEGRVGNTVVNYGRGKFTVAAAHSVGSRGSQMMMTLGDDYFKHLSRDLYGVTNYSVYIDKRLPSIGEEGDFMPDGGLGVLLNGSAVETEYVRSGSGSTALENFSSGYMFEWDPGAGGMTIRFNHYSSSIARPQDRRPVGPAFFDNDSWVLWGVQPLYAYDAAKASPVPYKDIPHRALNAPAQITFFKYPKTHPSKKFSVVTEDFEDHVLPPSDMVEKREARPRRWVGWGVYYRPPFLTRVDNDRGSRAGFSSPPPAPYRDEKDYRNGTFEVNENGPGPVPMKIFSRGRNNIGLNQWNIDANGWGNPNLRFGGSFGTSWGPGGVGTVYAFWHPQTWHLYDNMDWERNQVRPSSAHLKKDFAYGSGDWRSGWRFDIEYNLDSNFNGNNIDFAKSLPKEWSRRHILKLTVLEITRNITAKEVEPEWRDRIHHEHYRDDTAAQLAAAFTHAPNDVVHKAGDLFVRAEMIQLKRATDIPMQEDDWIYDSRNWVYSKPLWFGKFRGDGWRGKGEPEEAATWSLFKRMGMSMMHLVANPEPEGGDAQSFRGIVHGESPAYIDKALSAKIGPGRGVRVRSWKDHFRGWPFNDNPAFNKKNPRMTFPAGLYLQNLEKALRNIATSDRTLLHPDLTFTDDSHRNKRTAPLIDKLEDLERKHRLDGVWTPPAAIDLNGWALNISQKIPPLSAIDNSANPGHPDFGRVSYQYQEALRPQSRGFSADDIHYVNQWGSAGPSSGNRYETFGQYAFKGQQVQYERRRLGMGPNGNVYVYAYNGSYTDMLYVRLSQLRPDSGSAKPSDLRYRLNRLPVWGLYAIRAWDYQKSKMGMVSTVDEYIYDFQEPTRNNSGGGYLDNTGEGRKRLLMVVQGLQLPYQPNRQTSDSRKYITPQPDRSDANRYLRAPRGTSRYDGTVKDYREYKKNRERVFGLHFWGNARSKGSDGRNVPEHKNPNRHEINEVWIGEGFSPLEIREILGLDPAKFPLGNPPAESEVERITELYNTKK